MYRTGWYNMDSEDPSYHQVLSLWRPLRNESPYARRLYRSVIGEGIWEGNRAGICGLRCFLSEVDTGTSINSCAIITFTNDVKWWKKAVIIKSIFVSSIDLSSWCLCVYFNFWFIWYNDFTTLCLSVSVVVGIVSLVMSDTHFTGSLVLKFVLYDGKYM